MLFTVGQSRKQSQQTVYKGILFRSRLEARWAVFFDSCGVTWSYEPEYSESGNYLPDFLLRNVAIRNQGHANLYVEVKGYMTDDDWAKIKSFSHDKPIIVLGDIPHGDSMSEIDNFILNYPNVISQYFSFGTIDNDEYPAYPGINHEGRLEIFSENTESNRDEQVTLKAYQNAASARFERGEHPVTEQYQSTDSAIAEIRNTQNASWQVQEEIKHILGNINRQLVDVRADQRIRKSGVDLSLVDKLDEMHSTELKQAMELFAKQEGFTTNEVLEIAVEQFVSSWAYKSRVKSNPRKLKAFLPEILSHKYLYDVEVKSIHGGDWVSYDKNNNNKKPIYRDILHAKRKLADAEKDQNYSDARIVRYETKDVLTEA